ncbi:MAG: glycosyltransferase, partial [Verrucomicrobia bacterium]
MTESPMPALVVPVLNDAGGLERLLEWWWESGAGVPVWVVDGGSQDGSVEVAHRAGVGVIGSLPGRAVQMNRGAEAAARAGCNVFWFVHADSLPPKEAVRMIVRAI